MILQVDIYVGITEMICCGKWSHSLALGHEREFWIWYRFQNNFRLCTHGYITKICSSISAPQVYIYIYTYIYIYIYIYIHIYIYTYAEWLGIFIHWAVHLHQNDHSAKQEPFKTSIIKPQYTPNSSSKDNGSSYHENNDTYTVSTSYIYTTKILDISRTTEYRQVH